MNATVGNTLSGDALTNLPSINRDVSTFVTLQPGVSPDGSVAGAVVDQAVSCSMAAKIPMTWMAAMQVYTPSFATIQPVAC